MKTLSDSDIFHVIFTRFNVPSGGKEKKIRAKENWLDYRFDLFDRYCFPSIEAQVDQNFVWLVFFDNETPEKYLEIIKKYEDNYTNFKPIYVDDWTSEIIINAIKKFMPDSKNWLLTTRLDNDDALNMEFTKTLRATSFDGRQYINFTNGFTFSNGYAYTHKDMSNAFLSLVEPVGDIHGVWEFPHPEVIQNFDVTQLDMKYAWLQLIHGGNVSNKVRGNIAPPHMWKANFESLKKIEIKNTSTTSIWLDKMINSPCRKTRDVSIKLIKKITRK